MDIEAEAKNIQSFVEQGNYHAAYNIALSALNTCRRENDQAGTDTCLKIIQGVVDSLADEFGSKSQARR
ncbi:MAG: hypothetical protein GY935_13415 [Gammaproteobacteria bacterium]|nr:hypothetical protein [Gammaproteobacteria bacterium]